MGKKLTKVNRKHPHRTTYMRKTAKPKEKKEVPVKSIFEI
jgi:hypothetical protein